MTFFSRDSQRGFSALGIFIAGLAVIVLMGSTGFFQGPKSETGDNTIYTVEDAPQLLKRGLQMTKVNFSTPTPIPPTPTPIPSQGCFADSCRPVGNECACPDLHLTCKDGKCVAVDINKSGVLFKNYNCEMVDRFKWCTTCPGNMNGTFCIGKPVIYLYPEKPTFVSVALKTPGVVVESIPTIEKGNVWQNVLALPGGVLKYHNTYYRELYYESSQENINEPDNGIIIDTQNLQQELKSQTLKLGLLPNESDEFVDYWLPRLQALNKPYIFFSIISKEEKERTDHIEINPKPDVFIEFIAYFKGVETPFETKPFVIPSVPNRTGFTAIEWGGVIDR